MHKLEKILEPIFKRRTINEFTTPWQPAPNTDDFGQPITRLLLAAEIDEKVTSPLKSMMAGKTIWDGVTFKHTPRNLKALSEKLGFTVQETSSYYYPRDIFLRLGDGSIAYPPSSDLLKDVVERVHSSNLYLDKGATTRTRNQLFNHWTGYAENYALQSQQDMQTSFSDRFHPLSYTYLEGGNVLRLTNKQDEEVVLVGEDHLAQSFLLLELNGRDWDSLAALALPNNSLQEQIAKRAVELTEPEIAHYAEEMFSFGLLPCNGKSGLIKQEDQLNILLAKFFMPSSEDKIIAETERGWFRELAKRSGIVEPFNLTKEQIETQRMPVATYLTKLEIVHALMAIDCNVPKQNLHFITQVNYHLDAFLQPAPHHALFMVHHGLAAEMLEAIIANKNDLKLTAEDMALLEGYLAAAKKFDLEFGGLIQSAQNQLLKAGLEVIPTPGHFLYEPSAMYEQFPMPSDGICINFINALTGYSKSTQTPYYITHGIHAGEQVGSLLMDAYALFLRHHIPDISTFFIGYNPDHPNDFSEALDFWNRLETQSGIHCMTFPLRD